MTAPDPARERALGGVFAFIAYLLWGFLPLYFLLLAPTGPWELVAWRILLSLVFCVFLLAVTRAWSRFGAIIRQGRLLLWTAVAGVLIYINWQVFIIGVWVLGEAMPPERWVGFALVWTALIVLTVDQLVNAGRARGVSDVGAVT